MGHMRRGVSIAFAHFVNVGVMHGCKHPLPFDEQLKVCGAPVCLMQLNTHPPASSVFTHQTVDWPLLLPKCTLGLPCRLVARVRPGPAGVPPSGRAAAGGQSWKATLMRSRKQRQQQRGGSASGPGTGRAGGSWPTMLGWRCASRRLACMCRRWVWWG